ncbi:MAG TPA: HAMP domain-containing sensor histidine kinase [Ktedonobacteraceae bacterium]|nr:HAMP domain-containing sensor histidine kinase [Ktedonobacteraceae bacterium]
MSQSFHLPTLSLRLKLVLSYLGVALGAIIIMAIVVSFAIQSYFVSSQQNTLKVQAESFAQSLATVYTAQGNTWNAASLQSYIEPGTPSLLVIVDAPGNALYYRQPDFITLDDNEKVALTQALTQALKGQETQGQMQSTDSDNGFSGLYIAVPIRYKGLSNGQVIGAILQAIPGKYPQGFSPNDFLVNVNQAILITGLIIALVVIIFSMILARRLTRPLTSLTLAAEQMRQGDYARRVEPPRSMDEMGRLATSFNAMATTIEADVNELRRQEQLRRDMIANIAHDMLTPLTAIQGFNEALADDVITQPEQRQETAQLIGRETQRLRRLVVDMQQMTSLESGQTQLELAPLDIHTLVDETLAVIHPECELAGITVRNEIDPTTPPVQADSDRITQVLLNLLDNARRHTSSGGTITVGAIPKEAMLQIWISDTGSGIATEDLPHIFERFYRVDKSRTGATGGSGLGLSIVKAIITTHGGSISAESMPGKGTRIVFTLPLAQIQG